MTPNGNFDYTHRAKKQNRADIVSSVCAYLSAATLYFSSVFVKGIKFVPVLQLLALIAVVIGVFINQRYTWTSFVYGIIPKDADTGELYFVVYRVTGKRQSCLVKVDMAGLRELIPCTAKDDGKARASKYPSAERYNYCASMAPAKYTRAVFRADGGVAVIAFEPDSTLLSMMENVYKLVKTENDI